MLTAFPIRTYERRQRAVSQRLESAGIDALIVNFPDNINYLTGFDSLGYLWYQALVISPRLETPFFLTRTSEEPCTWELSTIHNAGFYDIATEDPIAIVADVLTGAKLDKATIGIESHAFTFTPAQHERLKSLLPEAKLADATSLSRKSDSSNHRTRSPISARRRGWPTTRCVRRLRA
jgi:Xaa-Pro dipeptidase